MIFVRNWLISSGRDLSVLLKCLFDLCNFGKLVLWQSIIQSSLFIAPNPLPYFFKRGMEKGIPRKGYERGMEKLLKGRQDPKKGRILQERGDAISLGIFSSWAVANVTTVIFNYILVIVFLFPLNVGVSPCFHCTVLILVYTVHNSRFHNTVDSSCYRLHFLFAS